MMGEHILYKDNIIFGGIYDNRFLIKNIKSINEEDFTKIVPYPGAKEMLLIESENVDEIKEIVMKVYNDLRK